MDNTNITKKAKDLQPGDKIYYYHRCKIYERTIAEINWDQCYIICFTKGGKYQSKKLRLYRYGYGEEREQDRLYVQYTKHYTSPESIKKHLRDDMDLEMNKVNKLKKQTEFHRSKIFNKARALNAFEY